MRFNSIIPVVQIALSAVGKLAFLLVNILLYKKLSVAEMGIFAIIYAVATVLATISECGLRGLLVRELARVHTDAKTSQEIMTTANKSRLLTLLPYILLGSGIGMFYVPQQYYLTLLFVLAGAWLDSNSLVLRGALRAFGHVVLDVTIAGTARLILLGCIAVSYWANFLTLEIFSVCFATIAFAETILTIGFIYSKTRLKPTINISFSKTISFLKRGSHFVLLAVLGLLYFRVGTFALGLLPTEVSLGEVAALNLSGKIPEGVTFLPIALMNAAIPFFSRNESKKEVIIPLLRQMEYVMGTAGIIIATGLCMFAAPTILLLSTEEYLKYQLVFQIYAASIVFTFLQYVYANLIVCLNYERQLTMRYGSMLILNIVLNLALVWNYGALGAVLALFICELTAVGIDLSFLSKKGMPLPVAVIGKWALVAASCVIIALGAKQMPGFAGILIYWLFGSLIGLIILLKARLSRHG